MLRLITFGGLSVSRAGAPAGGAAAQRRPLALLAQVAAAGERGVGRDTLIERLWPGGDEDRARRTLAQTLYSLRRDLAEPELVLGTDVLRLNPAVIEADVAAFGEALREGALERAVALHAGPFLAGVRLPEAPGFERWAEEERDRLAGQQARALDQLARLAHDRGAWAEEAAWLRRVAAQDPLDADVALRLMRALAAAGDRDGALQHARVHEVLVRQELELDPDPRIAALAHELREAPAAPAAPVAPIVPVAAAAPVESPPEPAAVVAARIAEPPPRRRWARAMGVAAVALVLVAATGWWATGGRMPGRAPSPVIAVLPFADLSERHDQAYFAEGVADELIAELGTISGLEVVARTSSFAFRGKDAPVAAIARDLHATHVLEGSVRRDGAGARLRVTVRLVDAATGFRVWSQTFEEPARDVLAVQDAIGREVVAAIGPRFAARVEAPRPRRAAVDPATYDLYLQGRYLYQNAGIWDSLQNARAIEAFRAALARDSSYAPAWAGLADVLGRLGDAAPQRDAAERALALDSSLADAHVSLAHVLAYGDRRWADAIREVDRALALNPGSVPALLRRAAIYSLLGRHAEAIADADHALRLDPLSPSVTNQRAWIYSAAGRWDDAIRIYRTLLTERPDQPEVHESLALTYLAKGMRKAAAAEFLAERWPYDGKVWGDTIAASIALDDRAAIRRFVREGEAQPHGRIGPLAMASLYASSGDRERALAMLERAHAEMPTARWLLYGVLTDPRLAPLRGDPRFTALAARWMSP